MTLVAVTGPAGARGLTTVTAALALTWPTNVLAVECDPTGGDLSAWWDVPTNPGLASAVAAAPAGEWNIVEAHIQRVNDDIGLLAAPLRSREAAVTVAEATNRLLPVLSALDQVHVVADAGRSAAQLAAAAVQAAVTVIVTCQTGGSPRATAATLERTGDLTELCAQRALPTVVAVVGDDPYPIREIERYLGAPCFTIADDPLGAAVIAGRPATGRLATRSPLLRTMTPLAVELHRHVTTSLGAGR